MKRIMREFKIHEISGVTTPAQKHARAVIMKRDFSTDQRDHLSNTGAALPDGSFPIVTRADLENAIHAIGRAKNPDEAKAHIISRAKTLGATDLLPQDWVSKSANGTGKDLEMSEAEVKKQVDEAVAKATADLTKQLETAQAKVAELEKAQPDVAKAIEEGVKAELAKRDEIAKNDESFEAEGKTIRKSAVGGDVFAVLKAQHDKIEIAEFTKRAEGEFKHLPGEPVAKAKAIRAVSKLSKEDREAVEAMLKAGETAMADRMKVIGKDGPAEGSASAKLEKLAEDHAKEKNVSKAVAMDAVLQTSEGRELYAQAEQEKRKS